MEGNALEASGDRDMTNLRRLCYSPQAPHAGRSMPIYQARGQSALAAEPVGPVGGDDIDAEREGGCNLVLPPDGPDADL